MVAGGPRVIARELTKIAEGFRADLIQAERQNARRALELARDISSGPHPQDEHNRLDHPYAKRHAGGEGIAYARANPAAININTGTFVSNWFESDELMAVMGTQSSGDDMVHIVYNTTWYGKFFDDESYPTGTSVMIARPILPEITRQFEGERNERIDRVMRRWF